MKKYSSNLFRFTFSLVLAFFSAFWAIAQVPQVPSELRFADLTIKINEQARREIQSDVDALYRNPTYFRVKAERVNLYLPIVERELRNAGVPTDFKYLVIQESSLVADAVSTSNAVGFWQFKQGTAEEVFLRVDGQIDERKNIVASSQGAARYLKKNNAPFDNWMCALVAYQMGLGGAKSYFGTTYNGKKTVEVDRNFHWYFKKFLAHKIAFEAPTVMLASNNSVLEEVAVQGPTSLKALAPRLGVTEAHLKEYNKWTAKGIIPDDRPYSVLYLRDNTPRPRQTVTQTQPTENPIPPVTVAEVKKTDFPKITGNPQQATQPNQIKVNDIDGVKAAVTTSQDNFTNQIGVKEAKFRRINDLEKEEKVEAGQYYYTKPKKTKADAETHIVLPGETLWSISQMYGIKLSALKSKNRINNERELKAGMILNLRDFRPRGEAIPTKPATEYRKIIANPGKNNVPSSPETSQPGKSDNNTNFPSSNQGPSSQKITHTVGTGENLFRISQKYGVTVDEIKKWNNLPDNNIKVGQKLIINKP
ncbi:LysM peptidoglycan-binding domain-containing protein [Cognataquiflexum rubidum]|uniref:LysM peptidoglycan-binding domain-containing protein n=1 Tax=Cognataquiflexum rubidum TaxID=2922273 RepID=UPI001F143F85|nr:LysM peptidoglycan-binding domain-containing protein [Cognataquiflexum rubidum]MCH6234572.1 LysM peptidoglycan-binding domain-containing protein [Cognataquiflexum rubidum]